MVGMVVEVDDIAICIRVGDELADIEGQSVGKSRLIFWCCRIVVTGMIELVPHPHVIRAERAVAECYRQHQPAVGEEARGLPDPVDLHHLDGVDRVTL